MTHVLHTARFHHCRSYRFRILGSDPCCSELWHTFTGDDTFVVNAAWTTGRCVRLVYFDITELPHCNARNVRVLHSNTSIKAIHKPLVLLRPPFRGICVVSNIAKNAASPSFGDDKRLRWVVLSDPSCTFFPRCSDCRTIKTRKRKRAERKTNLDAARTSAPIYTHSLSRKQTDTHTHTQPLALLRNQISIEFFPYTHIRSTSLYCCDHAVRFNYGSTVCLTCLLPPYHPG